MTTKQIAEAVGKNERSVQRWAKAVGDKMSSVGDKMAASSPNAPADYTLDETLAIIQHGMGKNAADLYRASAAPAAAASRPEVATLTERDLWIIGGIVRAALGEVDARVSRIEARVEERQALLPAPEMDLRSQVNAVVRQGATAAGIPFAQAWGDLYRDYGYRTHTSPKVAAGNRCMAIIDYLDAEGQLGTLLSVAVDLYGEARR